VTDYLSKKIRVLSLLAIVAVVYIHAYNLQDRYLLPWTQVQDPLSLTSFTEYFLSNGFGRFAVPIFFGISGYLYFRSFRLEAATYWSKFAKRLRTLALPYLLWASWALFLVWVLQQTDWGRQAVDTWDIFPQQVSPPLFLYRWLGNPVPFQLWFIRDLMLYVFISPVLYLLVRYGRWIPIALVGLFWFAHRNFVIMEAEGILFFLVGAYLAIHQVVIPEQSPKWVVPVTGICWVMVLLVKTDLAFSPTNPHLLIALHKIAILLGVITVWFGYDQIGNSLNTNPTLVAAAPLASFVYFAHEPLLNLLQNYAMAQWDTINPLAIYLTYPLLTVCLCLLIGAALRAFLPPVFSLLTGGRGS
jgi:surface polysaccharide O-acyltransferase-like enzyme